MAYLNLNPANETRILSKVFIHLSLKILDNIMGSVYYFDLNKITQ